MEEMDKENSRWKDTSEKNKSRETVYLIQHLI